MIEYPVDQGTATWLNLRLGMPTASEFHKIVTPTGKLSDQARGYAFRLIAEKLLKKPQVDLGGLEWVERGKELEPDAARMYEFEQDVTTKAIGFITTDDGRIGCSPDRLVVGHPGAVEIKCYAPQNHIAVMIDGFGSKHLPQVQGQLMIGGFEWVDRFAFHPSMPPVLERTYRDEDFIKRLSGALEQFCDMKDEMLERVRTRGLFAEREELMGRRDAA